MRKSILETSILLCLASFSLLSCKKSEFTVERKQKTRPINDPNSDSCPGGLDCDYRERPDNSYKPSDRPTVPTYTPDLGENPSRSPGDSSRDDELAEAASGLVTAIGDLIGKEGTGKEDIGSSSSGSSSYDRSSYDSSSSSSGKGTPSYDTPPTAPTINACDMAQNRTINVGGYSFNMSQSTFDVYATKRSSGGYGNQAAMFNGALKSVLNSFSYHVKNGVVKNSGYVSFSNATVEVSGYDTKFAYIHDVNFNFGGKNYSVKYDLAAFGACLAVYGSYSGGNAILVMP